MKCSKKVKHSVLIFGLNVLGTCIYRKIGKVIWFQIWISDYDLLVTVQYTYSILTFFHSLIENFQHQPYLAVQRRDSEAASYQVLQQFSAWWKKPNVIDFFIE